VTTTQAAERLGMSAEFVRGEIRDGRLAANVIKREGKRTVYRVTDDQLARYIADCWRPFHAKQQAS
jgi:hypothetical protein